MSEHFCDTCNRVRLSSVGELHTCLASDDATDLRPLLRGGGSDDELVAAIRDGVWGKGRGHTFQLSGEGGPRKHMISIGG
jgi:cyclic pyranopterin phosphate synthase